MYDGKVEAGSQIGLCPLNQLCLAESTSQSLHISFVKSAALCADDVNDISRCDHQVTTLFGCGCVVLFSYLPYMYFYYVDSFSSSCHLHFLNPQLQ